MYSIPTKHRGNCRETTRYTRVQVDCHVFPRVDRSRCYVASYVHQYCVKTASSFEKTSFAPLLRQNNNHFKWAVFFYNFRGVTAFMRARILPTVILYWRTAVGSQYDFYAASFKKFQKHANDASEAAAPRSTGLSLSVTFCW